MKTIMIAYIINIYNPISLQNTLCLHDWLCRLEGVLVAIDLGGVDEDQDFKY